jgi:hypothetical protein
MLLKYSLWRTFFLFLSSIYFTIVDGNRENLALRHPCNSINKRLEPYITWTEKLASTQYKGKLIMLFFRLMKKPQWCASYIFHLAKSLKSMLHFDSQQ